MYNAITNMPVYVEGAGAEVQEVYIHKEWSLAIRVIQDDIK
jgi:hypothetical protein